MADNIAPGNMAGDYEGLILNTRKQFSFGPYESKVFQFTVPHAAIYKFNYSNLGSKKMLVVGSRGEERPTLMDHEFKQKVITEGQFIENRILPPGNWHLTIYNDGSSDIQPFMLLHEVMKLDMNVFATSVVHMDDNSLRPSEYSSTL